MDSRAENSSKKPPPVPAGKRRGASAAPAEQVASSAPCGACKFLRRKCMGGCVFAPYFGTEQGAARFAAVHKVFGASNVSKLLLHVPEARRHDAVVTICYEAQARLSDPVYGCVATILALQQQVASLQAELSIVQSQLISSRLAAASVLQSSQPRHISVLQPAYSNNSSTSTDMLNVNGFQSSGLDLSDAGAASRGFEPLQSSQPSQEDDEEEESRNQVFSNEVFSPK